MFPIPPNDAVIGSCQLRVWIDYAPRIRGGLMPPQVKSVVPVYRAWERWMQMMHKRDAGAPGRRTVTMRRTLLVVVAAVVLAGLSGCSSTVSGTPTANLVSEQGLSGAGSASFVGADSNSVSFFAWTNDGQGHLTCSAQAANANPTYVQSGTGTPLTSGNAALTGTIINGAVSLHEELGATLVGTIQGSDLIMQIPQPDGTVEPYMFHPGSAAEYNAQLQKLAAQLQNQRSTVTSQQQAAKTAQDQSNAGQSLANDLSKLGADEGAVSDAINALPAGKKMVADAQAKTATAMAAARQSSPCDTSGILVQASSANTGGGVSASQNLLSAINTSTGSIGALDSDLNQAQKDEQTLLSLAGQRPPDYDRTVGQATSALSKAKSDVTAAQNVFDGATKQQQADQTTLDQLGNRPCK